MKEFASNHPYITFFLAWTALGLAASVFQRPPQIVLTPDQNAPKK